MTNEALRLLIEDLELNHEYCPKEVILEAASELRRLYKENQEWERVCNQHLKHITKLKKRIPKTSGEKKPAVWMLRTGHGTAFQEGSSKPESVYPWTPLYKND